MDMENHNEQGKGYFFVSFHGKICMFFLMFFLIACLALECFLATRKHRKAFVLVSLLLIY